MVLHLLNKFKIFLTFINKNRKSQIIRDFIFMTNFKFLYKSKINEKKFI